MFSKRPRSTIISKEAADYTVWEAYLALLGNVQGCDVRLLAQLLVEAGFNPSEFMRQAPSEFIQSQLHFLNRPLRTLIHSRERQLPLLPIKPWEELSLADVHASILTTKDFLQSMEQLCCVPITFINLLSKLNLTLSLRDFFYCTPARMDAVIGQFYRTPIKFLKSQWGHLPMSNYDLPILSDLPHAVNTFNEKINSKGVIAIDEIRKRWETNLVKSYYAGLLIIGDDGEHKVLQSVLAIELLKLLVRVSKIPHTDEIHGDIIKNVMSPDLLNTILSINHQTLNALLSPRVISALRIRYAELVQANRHIHYFLPKATELVSQKGLYVINVPVALGPILIPSICYANIGLVCMRRDTNYLTLFCHAKVYSLTKSLAQSTKHNDEPTLLSKLPPPGLNPCLNAREPLLEFITSYQNVHRLGIESISYDPNHNVYQIVFSPALYGLWHKELIDKLATQTVSPPAPNNTDTAEIDVSRFLNLTS